MKLLIFKNHSVVLMALPILLAAIGSPALLAGLIQPVGDPQPSAGSLGGTPTSAVIQSGDIAAPPPESEAPGVSANIEGINFDEGAANSVFCNIPPDPIGAAGPNHVVSVVNTSIEWHTKAGVQQLSQKLGTTSGGFFASLSPANGTFDPKVIYDTQAGRFVVVTLERRDTANGDPVNSSRILVAVSDDSDPNGTWYFLAINSKLNISAADCWADYPGLGVDEQAIYITNNMFGFGGGSYSGTRLWIINKTPLYTGGAGTFTVHDPFAGGGSATTAQPAQILGIPPSGTSVDPSNDSVFWVFKEYAMTRSIVLGSYPLRRRK